MRVAAISVAGLALFLWPFVASETPAAATSIALSLGVVAVLIFVEAATRRLDARRFALLAAIAAIDAALRLVLVTGLGGFSPVFFLILAAGYVYGPSYGFLAGSVALLASAVATGGIGPWLPYEMMGCGFVGLVAGLAGLRRSGPVGWRDVAALAAVGVVTGFAYGALLDVWDWTTFYRGTPGFGWQAGPLARHRARAVRPVLRDHVAGVRQLPSAGQCPCCHRPRGAGSGRPDPHALAVQRGRARPSAAASGRIGRIAQPEMSASTANRPAKTAPMISDTFDSGHGVRRPMVKVTPRVTTNAAP